MLTRLDHVEIIPQDMERSIAFYTGVLGFKVDHRIPLENNPITEVIYLTLNGSAIELLRTAAAGPAKAPLQAGYRLMAWEVDDMDATLKELAAKGAPATWGPRKTPGYIRAEITDPDGNAIELRQWLKKRA